jgi:MFS transporter, ACS family, hexuronate transporter
MTSRAIFRLSTVGCTSTPGLIPRLLTRYRSGVRVSSCLAITSLFAMATFGYASFTTIANVLPSYLCHRDAVACVSGLSGTGAGIGTIVAFKLIGYFSDARQAARTHGFDPIMIVAGLVPFVRVILVLLLVCNPKATDQGLGRRI